MNKEFVHNQHNKHMIRPRSFGQLNWLDPKMTPKGLKLDLLTDSEMINFLLWTDFNPLDLI